MLINNNVSNVVVLDEQSFIIDKVKLMGKEPVVIGVHDGMFHADDVISVAIYAMFVAKEGRQIIVVRTRNKTILDACHYLFDVGMGQFDHHQREGVPFYENGVKYAACGLVARFALNKRFYQFLLDRSLYAVQAEDNGQDRPEFQNPFEFIDLFNATWEEGGVFNNKIQTKKFYAALEMVSNVLLRLWKKYCAIVNGEAAVDKMIAEAKDGVVEIHSTFIDGMMNKVISVNEGREEKLAVLLYERKPGAEYAVHMVRKQVEGFDSWASNDQEYCRSLPGFIFVHSSGFFASFDNIESARLAAKRAIANMK